MTNPTDLSPLAFTRYMSEQMNNYVIGALERPIPATDPVAAYRYNESRARTLQNGFRQRPLLRLQDKNLQQLTRIGGERSTRFEEIATDTGEAGVVIRGGSDLGDFVRNAVRIEEDLHLSIDVNPLRPSWKTRWGGKITTINVKRDSEGVHTVELLASANREHLKHVLVGTTPFFPPEVQPLSLWLLPGNCRTVCAATLFINLMRQFEPGLSTLTNIMNPFGWINPFGPDAILNFLPTEWPIQVQFVDPLTDQSRTTVFSGAWNDFHTASLDIMRDAGVCARAYTVFTDDIDHPQPELASLLPQTPLNSIPIIGSLVGLVEGFLNNTGLESIPDTATVADLARPQRNCARGTERFLTREGTKTFAETAGTTQQVLGYHGEWTTADIKAFGKQELYRIVVTRYGYQKELFFTAGHRWFKSGQRRMNRLARQWSTELTTVELQPGDCLASRFKTSHLQSVRPSAVGIQAGIVFGDGSRTGNRGTTVKLFGEKDAQLLKWFPMSATRAGTLDSGVAWTEILDLPGYFKDSPPLAESASYLYGWLAGYFAADGCVSKEGNSFISTCSLDHARLVEDICHSLGIRTYGIRTEARKGFGCNESLLHRVGLVTRDLGEDFFLVAEHRERAGMRVDRTRPGRENIADWTVVSVEPTGIGEEVYCAVVPDGQAFVLENNILTGNCVMVAFEDHSQYAGPTGTGADGVINLFASTLDDLISTTVFPVGDNAVDGIVDPEAQDPIFANLFGVAPSPPWAVYRDGQFSGIIESNYTQHKGPVKTVMTGGKSPKLVNDIQTFLIKYALSQLQVTIVGGLGGSVGDAPLGSGLEELYQNQLSDKLLAWQRFTDPLRALYTGDLGYLETFERGNAAYTISAILSLRQGNWKTRAFRSFKTSIRQSAPYIIYYDILLDDRVGFEQDGIIYVDQIHAFKYEYDRRKPITYTVSVGDDTKDQDPFSQGIKALQGLGAVIGAVVGGDTLFG